jgi:hypothetical protein
MATLTLFVPEDTPHFDQVTNLDGVEYLLQFRYNQREERFSVSIGSPDGTIYHRSAVIICNWPLFQDNPDPRLPPGMLMVIPSGNDDSPPTLGELGPGKRCELMYLEAADLAEVGL